MKKHLVTILYKLPDSQYLMFTGMVNEVLGDNGRAIVYPCGIFKQAFGYRLPDRSTFSIY